MPEATINTLKLKIEKDAESSVGGILNLTNALTKLKEAVGGGNKSLNATSKAIASLGAAVSTISSSQPGKIASLAGSLAKLKDITLSSTIAKNIQAISMSLSQMDVNVEKLNAVANAMNAIAKAGKNASGASNALASVTKATSEATEEASQKTKEAAEKTKEATKSTKDFEEANKKLVGSIFPLFKALAGLGVKYATVKRVITKFFGAMDENNEYVEALNLATITMGEATDAAVEYARAVENLAGINQTNWLSNLGQFNQMVQGFDIGSEKANIMSQQLTQLAYDIQSAFNEKDLETVMGRLQSGISGQVKGMRSYGVELSKAAIEEFALANGITKSWSEMTMAEKVMLRYQKIMTSTTNIQGDLARTITTPANALRVLSNQWAIAKRYMGQVVSIVATAVIPIFQTLTAVIGAIAQMVANLLGYELPSINYQMDSLDWSAIDDAEDAAEGTADGLENAAASAKKMKDYLMGFDELNVISPDNGSSSSGVQTPSATVTTQDLTTLFDPYQYDFLDGLTNDLSGKVDEWKEKIQPFFDWMEENWDGIVTTATAIGAVIAGWALSSALSKFVGLFSDKAGQLVLEKGLGITLTLVGISLLVDSIEKIIDGDATIMDYVNAGLGVAGTTAGVYLLTKNTLGGGLGMQLGLSIAGLIAGATLVAGTAEKISNGTAEVKDYLAGGLGMTILGGSFASLAAMAGKLTDGGMIGYLGGWSFGLGIGVGIAAIGTGALVLAGAIKKIGSNNLKTRLSGYLQGGLGFTLIGAGSGTLAGFATTAATGGKIGALTATTFGVSVGIGIAALGTGALILAGTIKQLKNGKATIGTWLGGAIGVALTSTGAGVLTAAVANAAGVGTILGFSATGFGLVVGLAVAAIATSVLLVAGKNIDYTETEEYEALQSNIEDLFGSIEGTKEVIMNMQLKVGSMKDSYGQIKTQEQAAKELADEIFSTPITEAETLKEKIEELNRMKIDGLSLEYDALTGKISASKDEVDELIERHFALATINAIQSNLEDLYTDYWGYQYSRHEAETEVQGLQQRSNMYLSTLSQFGLNASALASASDEELEALAHGQFGDPEEARRRFGYDANQYSRAHANAIRNIIGYYLTTRSALNEAGAQLEEIDAAITPIEDAIDFFEGELEEANGTLDETNGAVDEGTDETTGYGKASREASAAVRNLTVNTNGLTRTFSNGITTWSKGTTKVKTFGNGAHYAALDATELGVAIDGTNGSAEELQGTLDTIPSEITTTVSLEESSGFGTTQSEIKNDLDALDVDPDNVVTLRRGSGFVQLPGMQTELKSLSGTRDNTVTVKWYNPRTHSTIEGELVTLGGYRSNTVTVKRGTGYTSTQPRIASELDEVEGTRSNTVTVSTDGTFNTVEEKLRNLSGKKNLAIAVRVTQTERGLIALENLNTAVRNYQDAIKAGKDTTGPMASIRDAYGKLDKTLALDVKANGGYVNQGQLFIAQEAGPELVGQIGGRTAVANNDQIVEAVAKGVYEAMMASQSGGKDVSFNLYIDGKQVTAAVEKTQRKRGATVLQKGVVNYG